MYIYLLRFNNYYNRIIKKFDTMSEYMPYVIGSPQQANYAPIDGVNMKQIVNIKGEIPDYVIFADNGNIISRWFVIEATTVRGGQYELDLHRDLIVDNYDEVVNAPCFIEKATLDKSNPLIFNKEDMDFNQIKTSETLLKDNSQGAWLVGYIPKTVGENKPFSKEDGQINNIENVDIEINGPLSDWEYAKYIDKELGSIEPAYIDLVFQENLRKNIMKVDLLSQGVTFGEYAPEIPTLDEGYAVDERFSRSNARQIFMRSINTLKDNVEKKLGLPSSKTIFDIQNLNGQVIQYLENGILTKKRISIMYLNGNDIIDEITPADGALDINMTTYCNEAGILRDDSKPWATTLNYQERKTILTLVNAASGAIGYNIPATRNHIADAPYDIFCIPYGDTVVNNLKTGGQTYNIRPSKNIMLNVATEIAAQLTGSLYDLQLLPYCPIQSLITSKGHIDLFNLTESVNYTAITGAGGVLGVILFPSFSTFSFNINISPIKITNTKIQAETEMYRLCSPNGNGAFEFNAAKNDGVEYFNVDCCYKPFNPYIHVNPNFKRLYGRDYNDTRGLICGGDFSIGTMEDRWYSYELNNKNYQQIFNRQIQNMEFNNKYQRMADIANATVGSFTGLGSGAIMGGLVNKTAIGAIGGAAASGIAGATDIAINQKLRNEAIDYTKDQFGYQLGNIKALPDSIAKTTAFTNNNKIFPILEFYTCTAEEKEALKNKIKYNGMTVMTIGRIIDYQRQEPTYIKGRIIRLENIPDDFHCLNAIAEEVNKGVFI